MILFFFSITGYCLALKNFFKVKEFLNLYLALCFVTILNYWCGVFEILPLGSSISTWLGISLFCFYLLKMRIELFQTLWHDPSQVVFWPIFILIYLKFKNAAYSGGDEFSFWGWASKIIYQTGHFITKDSTIFSKDYIPGTQSLHYYFYNLFGFTEGISYVATLAVFLSFFVIFIPYILKIKQQYARYSILLAMFLFPFLNLNVLLTIGTEYLISLSFIFMYLFDKESSSYFKGRMITFIIGLSLLIVLKHIGFFFALFFILSFLIKTLWMQFIKNEKDLKKEYALFAIGIVSIFLTQYSWSYYVKTFLVSAPFTVKIDTGIVDKILAVRSLIPPYYQLILSAFAKGFFAKRFFVFEVQSFALLFIAYRYYSSEVNKKDILNLLLFYVAYVLLILISYFFLFGDYEAIRVASFSRYIGTYIVSLQMFAIFLIVKNFEMQKIKRRYLIILILLMNVFTIENLPNLIKQSVKSHEMTLDRRIIKEDAKYLISKIPTKSHVYIFSQESMGGERLNFAYEMDNFNVNHGCWAIGKKNYEGDVWTCEVKNGEVITLLAGYDYIYVHKSNKQLEELFMKEFSILIGSRDKFKIVKNQNSVNLMKL